MFLVGGALMCSYYLLMVVLVGDGGAVIVF